MLQDEDYDAEDDDEDQYDDGDEEGITDIPEFGQCLEGYKKDADGVCIGEDNLTKFADVVFLYAT